jgi:sarcosine oxidase
MSDARSADVVVVGLGVMGSATVDALAGRGWSVVGVDAHQRGHALGSSHGPTRIIRRAIEEGPAYVPLVLDAFDRWAALQSDAGRPIIDLVGAIRIAPAGSPLLDAFRASADRWDLPFESLDGREVVRRFPGFSVPDDYAAVFESGAGLLHAAAAVAAFQSRAERRGATLRFDEPVTGWTAGTDGVTVLTPNGTVSAGSLVLAAGAWTTALAPTIGLPLVAHRVVNVSFTPHDPDLFRAGRLPAFIVADEHDGIYGVPIVPGEGLKVGSSGTPTDPDHVDRRVTEEDVAALRAAVDRFLPKASGPVASALTCLYTVAPDGDFVIDVHPEHANVVVASPCSGHGFKFASAIGPLLADLATGASPAFDLEPFRIDRFAAGRPQQPSATSSPARPRSW